MARRSKTYRPAGREREPVEGASVIVVDDGIATGSTMAAACRALRSQQPAEIVIAVPVASRQAIEMLESLADRIHVLDVPRFFGAVGSHYLDFRQTTDDEVRTLLE
jgi:predicted phosphoribosyltransferase